MSDSRKNRLSIDGGQIAEDDQVASYKQIPEADTELRTSKHSLAKSTEKLSSDGAEEKLLPKGEEVKIVTRVDMADAKYVVEDHRNGDAKIELDANKKQFTGLCKEELMKYAKDPFWVNVRWFMFVLFWCLWLCMLAGAITIIVKAPKCAAPMPRTWFEKGPLVEMDEATYNDILPKLPILQNSKIQGIFIDVPTYQYKEPSVIENFKNFVQKAKEYGVKVIVDLIPNYVTIDHEWFLKSVNKSAPFTDYFIWRVGKDYINDVQNPPNNWISTEDQPAWTKNENRGEFYLHQYGATQPDLNFNNEAVVKEFDNALNAWMKAGAAGVRLNRARQLLVNTTGFPDELPAPDDDTGYVHTQYAYYSHQYTSDLPQLDVLLARWSALVGATSETPSDTVFTMAEESGRKPFLVRRNLTSLRPAMTFSVTVISDDDLYDVDKYINARLQKWPAIQLMASGEADKEVTALAMLLPATPIFSMHQLEAINNDTTASKSMVHLVSLRQDPSVEHGRATVRALPAYNNSRETLLTCARWKVGHTGYVAVFNPLEEDQRADLTMLQSVPDTLTVHHITHGDRLWLYTNYSSHYMELADDVLVPPKSTVVLSYVPKTAVEH